RWRWAVGVGSRLSCHPDAGPHEGALRPAVPRPFSLHRRPPGLGPGRAAAFGVRGLLLVLVAAAGRVDAAAGGLSLRVGVARPRPEGAFTCERDARANPALGRDDEDWIMARNILRTGKQTRPKTAVKGKRYHCA